ncbi:hypothetical protein GTW51_08960 [Aurantimonas aggregata]|uniref:Uncharacterized protein n=1 Tax=Aurantimonas aggregata TaxID=2047720 RepID=A0A6L9MGJ0_9HYPH|nr:hypothetical protein [Aurantimonas aggregata]NDV86831.1 hypothetical protein [Aurantimonas aggregata]
MVGLTLAVNVDLPSLLWPLGGEMHVPAVSGVPAEPRYDRDEVPGRGNLKTASVMAAGKGQRLPALASQAAVAPSPSGPTRPIVEASLPSDVVLFDQCMPSCESQDPLLAANRAFPDATPSPAAPAIQITRYVEEKVQVTATRGGETGLVEAVSSRLAAAGQAGFRVVAGGLTSLSPW